MQTITSADGTPLAVTSAGTGPAVILVGGAFNDRSTVAGLAAAAVAAAVPGAVAETLPGQDHGVLHQPEALVPVLRRFLG